MLLRFLRRLGAVLIDGPRVWVLAPIIPLIAILPEFAQHIVEISLGMFESEERFKELGMDPLRWAFAIPKLTGYLLAILATARFWTNLREGLPWWSMKSIAWRVLGLAFLANVVLALAMEGVNYALADAGDVIKQGVTLIVTVATLPIAVWLIAGLLGDKDATFLNVYKSGWGAALRIAAFSAVILIPLMWLHEMNHQWAFGQPAGIVWALMVFDSLLVGLLATGWGTAIHHGYRKLAEPIEG